MYVFKKVLASGNPRRAGYHPCVSSGISQPLGPGRPVPWLQGFSQPDAPEVPDVADSRMFFGPDAGIGTKLGWIKFDHIKTYNNII